MATASDPWIPRIVVGSLGGTALVLATFAGLLSLFEHPIPAAFSEGIHDLIVAVCMYAAVLRGTTNASDGPAARPG